MGSACGRTYSFKFFKGCLPQILLVPFLNTLPQMIYWVLKISALHALSLTTVFRFRQCSHVFTSVFEPQFAF